MKTSVLLALCSSVSLLCTQAAAGLEESAKLHALFDAEWEHAMQVSPTWASQLGDRRYNDRWPDLSLEAIEREQRHARELLQHLAVVDRAKLTQADLLNLDLFRWQ